MWSFLKSQYDVNKRQEYTTALNRLADLEFSKYSSIEAFQQAFSEIQGLLASHGQPLPEEILVSFFVRSIRRSRPTLAEALDSHFSSEEAPPSQKTLDYAFKRLRTAHSYDSELSVSSQKVLQTQSRGSYRSRGNIRGSKSHSPRRDLPLCDQCNQHHLRSSEACWYIQPDKATPEWREKNKARIEQVRNNRNKSSGSGKGANTEPVVATTIGIPLICAATRPAPSSAFYLDSCSAVHIVNSMEYFIDYQPDSTLTLQGFNGSSVKSRGKGTIRLYLTGATTGTMLFRNVYYCPESQFNLIGLYALWNKASSTSLNRDEFTIQGSNWSITASINSSNNLLQIHTQPTSIAAVNKPTSPALAATESELPEQRPEII